MDTFLGAMILLGFILMLNWWWIKKIIFKVKLKNLEKKRLSSSVNNVYQAIIDNNYADFSAGLSVLSRSEVYELENCLSNADKGKDFIKRYANEHAQKPAALYLLGSSLIDDAWAARGSGGAGTVNQDQANQFFNYLQEAEGSLRTLLNISPDYVEAYALLIRIQMGLGNMDESWSLYNEAKKIEPGRLDFGLAMLVQLTEKWGGSHEQMFKFAREEVVAGKPEFSAGLLVAAHYEYWLTLDGKESDRYYKDKSIKKELLDAIGTIAEIKSDHDFSSRHQKMLAQNCIAFCYLHLNEKKKARKVFRAIGEHYTNYPWKYMDDKPAAAYLRFRGLVRAGSV